MYHKRGLLKNIVIIIIIEEEEEEKTEKKTNELVFLFCLLFNI